MIICEYPGIWYKKLDVNQQTKAKQTKANTIIELKQTPSEVSQEMNVKEIKKTFYMVRLYLKIKITP